MSLNVNLQKGELISPQYGATIAVHTLTYFFFPGGFSYTYKISRDQLDVSDYTHNINALYSQNLFSSVMLIINTLSIDLQVANC